MQLFRLNLKKLKQKKDVKKLLGVTTAMSREDRRSANVALHEVTLEMVSMLVSTLKNSDPAVRASAAATLKKISGVNFVESFKALLNDEDYRVKETAAKALKDLGWEPEYESKDAILYWILTRDPQKCIEMGPKTVEVLKEILPSLDQDATKELVESFELFLSEEQAEALQTFSFQESILLHVVMEPED